MDSRRRQFTGEHAEWEAEAEAATEDAQFLPADINERLLLHDTRPVIGCNHLGRRPFAVKCVRYFSRSEGSLSMNSNEEESPPAYTITITPIPNNNNNNTTATANSNSSSKRSSSSRRGSDSGSRSLVRRLLKLVKSLGGLSVILLLYTFLGAFIMMKIEGPHENERQTEVSNIRATIVAQLRNNTQALRGGEINETEWERQTDEYLKVLEAKVHDSGVTSSSKKQWTFFGAVLFCVTTYTTIGYGNIAPATKAGRVATMLYATLGIPLALIVLADLGRRFTTAFKFLWSFLRRYYYTGYCRKVRNKVGRGTYDMGDTPGPSGADVESGAGDCRRQGSYRKTDSRTGVSRGCADGESSGVGNEHSSGGGAAAPPVSKEGRGDMDGNGTSLGEVITTEGRSSLRGKNDSHDSIFLDQAELSEDFKLPVTVAVGFIFVYMFLGAGMYTLWEDWSYLESFYFVFITTSTIGFGDVLPKHPNFFLLSCVYTFLGLALVSMAANVIMEWLAKTIIMAKEKVDKAAEKAVAKAKAAKSKVRRTIRGKKSGPRPKDRSKRRAKIPSPTGGKARSGRRPQKRDSDSDEDGVKQQAENPPGSFLATDEVRVE